MKGFVGGFSPILRLRDEIKHTSDPDALSDTNCAWSPRELFLKLFSEVEPFLKLQCDPLSESEIGTDAMHQAICFGCVEKVPLNNCYFQIIGLLCVSIIFLFALVVNFSGSTWHSG